MFLRGGNNLALGRVVAGRGLCDGAADDCSGLQRKRASAAREIRQLGLTRAGRDKLLELGATVRMRANADLPYLEGVGWAERRKQHDGRAITTIYPKMLYRKTLTTLRNVDWKLLSNEGTEADKVLPNPFAASRLSRSSLPREFNRGLRAITDDCADIGERGYYFEDGFRKVRPYYIVLDSTVQEEGLTLESLIQKFHPFYYRRLTEFKVKSGQIMVNFCSADIDQPLKRGDFVSNLKHQHEPPVLDWHINVLFENNDLLVVNKPPSYVISPMSGSRFNSLIYVLRKELGPERAGDLRMIHRLDKYTSGVLCFAKGAVAATKMLKVFNQGRVAKEYLALVDGIFPPGHTTCSQPLDSFENILSTSYYGSGAKESFTSFERLETDIERNVSLVRCLPKTGRTHQIRLHLQCLGFHIVNDCLYNPQDKATIMNNLDQGLKDQALQRLEDRLAEKQQLRQDGVNASSSSWPSVEEWLAKLRQNHYHSDECLVCELKSLEAFGKVDEVARDCSFMCLHARKYQLDPGMPEFVADKPRWMEDPSLLNQVFARRERQRLHRESSMPG